MSSPRRSTASSPRELDRSSSTTRTSRGPRAATWSRRLSVEYRVPARCVWLDAPLAQAQVNLVERLLEQFGSLPAPEKLRSLARRVPGVLLPTSQMRAVRELEPPSADEGFAAVERVPFVRAPPSARSRAGVFVAAAALDRPGWQDAIAQADPGAPHLVFDWRPDGSADDLAAPAALLGAEVSGLVEIACVRTPAVRRLAGAGPRCPGFRSTLRGPTASTRRSQCFSGRAPRTGRSRRRSALATSRSEPSGCCPAALVQHDGLGGDGRPAELLDGAPAARFPEQLCARGSASSSFTRSARSCAKRAASTGSRVPSSRGSNGTSRPVTPSSTTSGIPPVGRDDRRSHAIASRLTMPSGS